MQFIILEERGFGRTEDGITVAHYRALNRTKTSYQVRPATILQNAPAAHYPIGTVIDAIAYSESEDSVGIHVCTVVQTITDNDLLWKIEAIGDLGDGTYPFDIDIPLPQSNPAHECLRVIVQYVRTHSHHYLLVPVVLVNYLGLQPSTFSRIHDGLYWLEGDCDGYEYVEAARKRLGLSRTHFVKDLLRSAFLERPW